MMSYMSLVFTDGCFAYDLELTPVKQEKIVKGKGDGDWFVLGLVGVVFAGASCFVVVSLVAVISGLFLVVVLVGEEVEKEGCWLCLELGAAGCLRLKLARWFAAVVVGSSENMEMVSFPVALGRVAIIVAAGSKQRERRRKLGFLGRGFLLPELRRILSAGSQKFNK
ncbi:hypothetical protein KY289_030337 [Solanum tuberosum]|nr:hypothetical protein KY289_030337 [Solanum tuberosum]